ncbi:MAG: hypothetical protein JO112_22310 [Planctomycetes bacterium]|nr:hypothetical protein [Planctomycetota bacterium]
MAIAVACPNCDQSYQLADTWQGKKVRCKKCQEEFVVRPASSRKGPARVKRTAEDEEDEVPRRRKRPVDEEEDRPIRKKRRGPRSEKSTGSLTVWLVVGGVAGVLLLGGGALVLWKLAGRPKEGAAGQASTSSLQPASGVSGSSPAARTAGGVAPAAVKVPVESPQGRTDRVLLATGAGHLVGICYRHTTPNTPWFVDFYNVDQGKRTGHIDLANMGIPQQVVLSPDGTLLAVAELLPARGGLESAVTIWSVSDGRILQSKWRPYGGSGASGALVWMTFLNGNRLLTLTTEGQLSLWNQPGQAVYSFKHATPGQTVLLMTDPYTKQPNNFALSADRSTVALFNGSGFDLVNTATGQPRSQTGPLVPTPGGSIRALALNRDGSRLAVFLWGFQGQNIQAYLALWDFQAQRGTGPLPSRVTMDNTNDNKWPGVALSWWGPNHLLLWDGNANALVLDAASGQPQRQLEGAFFGQAAYDDPEGRLWYHTPSKPQAYLCGVDFPDQEVQGNQALDAGKYYPLWWLTANGVDSQPERNDPRSLGLTRAGPS